MGYKNILYETKEGIGWITLNRPEAMNALNTAMIQELGDAMEKVEGDSETGVVIIMGAGDKAFSAGADLKEIQKLTIKGAFDYSRLAHRIFSQIEQSGKPVIACINGMAMGGGAELALSCHLKIASDRARLSFPEAGLGGIPGMGGTQKLPRLIGKSVALYYLLTGDTISAEIGLQLGLIHKVSPPEELRGGAEDLAKNLLKKSPLSLKFVIQAVTNGTEGNIEEGLVLESALMAAMTSSGDKEEGIKAIFEKRPPKFKRE
ncbi:MAG: enoyl-CoA hydratase/isomerase family protein [Deltaproteobacteria bacterium]|nr:MAG: enoyl-CoA hydratase/isomerase family protein [Deltaproteobacteria bacterium]